MAVWGFQVGREMRMKGVVVVVRRKQLGGTPSPCTHDEGCQDGVNGAYSRPTLAKYGCGVIFLFDMEGGHGKMES